MAVAGFVFTISFGVWHLIRVTVGIRVTAEEELEGLDVGEHGMSAYPEFAVASDRHTEMVAPRGPGSPHPKLKPGTEVALER